MARKAWITNTLLLLVTLVVSGFLMEGLVRLIAPQPTGLSHQDRYGLAMHYPGITRYLPQFGHDVSFNSMGMRDGEHTLQKPGDVFRILVLGDSFMEALQVPFAASLPSQLQQQLTAATGRKIEVVNAGVSGWGTDDELRYLTEYGLTYQPDLVVVAMTLHNDVSDNLRQEWHKLSNGTLTPRPVAPMSFTDYKITQLKAFIATHFQLYQLWRRVRHGGEMQQIGKALNSHVIQLFETPPQPNITKGFNLTAQLLGAVRDTARSAGARVALVLLPIKYQLTDTGFASFAKTAIAGTGTMEMGRPQQWIGHIADGLGLPVVDLLPAFRRRVADSTAPLYLEWDGHWNEAGHLLAATETVHRLLADSLVPGGHAATP